LKRKTELNIREFIEKRVFILQRIFILKIEFMQKYFREEIIIKQNDG
jgi:hypothetical protein